MASRKVLKLKSFYSHSFVYVIGVIVYILKEYTEAPLNFFPIRYINGFVMCLWTTAFLISAVDLFASYQIFGDKWEERKVKSIMQKNKEKQKWE